MHIALIDQWFNLFPQLTGTQLLVLGTYTAIWLFLHTMAVFTGECEGSRYGACDNEMGYPSTWCYDAMYNATWFGKAILYPLWIALIILQWTPLIILVVLGLPFILFAVVLAGILTGLNYLMFKQKD